ncbi:MAG: phenylacetate-CoA oxygenase subunit PaaC [Anaerolineae bacterium]|nr:phenylacetate-CoA oxygenase subunit PaaC [Anaerolineae bacterium]
MNHELQDALVQQLMALADDELILGHRNSEWCGHAPILEEDIAFANIALDEIGHAQVWYGLLADLTGEDREIYPDKLVYWREANAYRCASLVELPKGDWAFTMLRQYLFDLAEKIQLEHLLKSAYKPLAEAAAKMRAEEIYHLRHTSAWVKRLGLGTDESNQRMQNTLDELWSYAWALFEPLKHEPLLVEAGYIPESRVLRQEWLDAAVSYLRESGLKIPDGVKPLDYDREGHTEHLSELLGSMQQVAHLYPNAKW